MRVVFAGPSLPPCDDRVVWQGPARHGDLVRAMRDGATHIGFIDGLYDDVSSVWHKEILAVLAAGLRVYGGASLGAVRAADCAAFGMIGVGRVHALYASGALDDDAAVAQLHAPAELGYAALTEARVNIEATLERLGAEGRLDAAAAARLSAAAGVLFFKERTLEAIVEQAGYGGEEAADLLALLETGRVDVKRADARAVVAAVIAAPHGLAPKPGWRLASTFVWRQALASALAREGESVQALASRF
jgi:hypothetical protein